MGEGYSLVAAGLSFALTVAGCVLLGVWLDRRAGTSPLLTLVCSLGGIGWAGFWLINKVRAAEAKRRRGE